MLITAVPPNLAPQTTGHPAGLPQTALTHHNDQRVSAPKSGGETADARTHLWKPQDTPRKRYTAPDGAKTESAPPTILQLKINRILEEQQAELSRKKEEALQAEAAETFDSAASRDAASENPPSTRSIQADKGWAEGRAFGATAGQSSATPGTHARPDDAAAFDRSAPKSGQANDTSATAQTAAVPQSDPDNTAPA